MTFYIGCALVGLCFGFGFHLAGWMVDTTLAMFIPDDGPDAHP